MPLAWRLVREVYAEGAFSGWGAAQAGGRWNSSGVRLVYTSHSQSLACLETLVHLNPRLQLRYVIIRAQFSPNLIETLPETELPGNWRAEPPAESTQSIGDRWAKESRSAVLRVPSALVPAEANFLLNPQHPEFASIKISEPEPFAFDQRLLR